MSFCQTHFTELLEKIRERGLEPLVAKTGSELISRFTSELAHGRSKTTFDPLLSAHLEIVRNAVHQVLASGPTLQAEFQASPQCPLCFVINHCHCKRKDECTFLTWTTKAADNARRRAIEVGAMVSDAAVVSMMGGPSA